MEFPIGPLIRTPYASLVSIDDLIELMADEMSELAKLISKEQAEETWRKPAD